MNRIQSFHFTIHEWLSTMLPMRGTLSFSSFFPSRFSASLSYFAQVLAFCLCWSVAFPLAKLALRDAPPFKLLCIRFLLASGLMLAWVVVQAHRRGEPVFPPSRSRGKT
ncbi:EamA family transporter, partial [Leptospira sp. SA-E8]|uniref:EamA family transporter n=1 Tax=Leptospira sp. SA-E8 TaxID=3422259 RepID=UPI003EB832BB